MIHVKKGSKPQILKDNGKKWNKEFSKKWKKYKKEGGKSPKAKYNKKPIKNAIKKEFSDKCAFCETFVSHSSPGDIEHFKPKSKYCRYAHTWSNLLYSCRICNGRKSNTFPTKDKIINPTKEKPEKFFEYEILSNGSLIKLKPLNNRAANSILLMDLNRDDLSSYRGKQFKKLQRSIVTLRSLGATEHLIETQILPYIEKEEEYAGMYRYIHANNLI